MRRVNDIEVEPRSRSLFWEEKPEHFLIGTRAMRFADKEKKNTHHQHVQVSDISAEAHRYVVNGRTPLEWFIDRYKITQDRNSGIVNDPNGWFDNPRDLITKLKLELQRQEHQAPPDNEEKSMYIACYILSLSGKIICANIEYSVYNSLGDKYL